jgi:hypothetical protein
MINLLIGFGFVMFFLSAIVVGRWEKFIFGDKDFPIGPPNFLRYFVWQYHVPMAMFVFCYALTIDIYLLAQTKRFVGVVYFIPTWAWIEDMFYWVMNEFDTITDKSWITGGMGGFHIGKHFIPYVYCGLFVLTTFMVWWRLL